MTGFFMAAETLAAVPIAAEFFESGWGNHAGGLGLLFALIFFVPFVWSYAEIHYRLPGIPSRLFKKEPEIVFDLPHRAQSGQSIPLFLFIKDADRFPVWLYNVRVAIRSSAGEAPAIWEMPPELSIDTPFFSRTFFLPSEYFAQPGDYNISAELSYQVGSKRRRLVQDNYRGIDHEPLAIFVSGDPLPSLPGLHWGDLHLHSNYTDDQIEFGAPIRETAVCAKAMGLSFIAVTDHSYDLDDQPGNYLKNDPDLKKWKKFREETGTLNRELSDFAIFPGEEISAGNQQNRNVHCLLLGNRVFQPGSGDSGEKTFANRPTLSLPQVYESIGHEPQTTIIAAAHPLDQPPKSHQWILNRGYWQREDLSHPALDYWQILNGRLSRFFEEGLSQWIRALLKGQRVGILGGTDAHGNFNSARQIVIPFIKMNKRHDQLLGQTRTGIFCPDSPAEAALLNQLKRKRAIISTGPAASLEIFQEGKAYQIGDTIRSSIPFRLRIRAVSSAEFGPLAAMSLHTGDLGNEIEDRKAMILNPACFDHQTEPDFPDGLPRGYIRLEVYSRNRRGQFLCLTNPIWIE